MKPLLLCVAGCLLRGAAAGCNKNKHCSDDEFCYSTTSGGACSALIRFRSQRRASERAAADAEDFKLEAALSDAADEMAVPEKQAAP